MKNVSYTHEINQGGENMTNVELLQQKIEESGLSPVVLAAAWKVSLPTYYKLIAGEREFTASQIVVSVALFNLTLEERDLIFLTENVSETHENAED
jgi:hypothetical protein